MAANVRITRLFFFCFFSPCCQWCLIHFAGDSGCLANKWTVARPACSTNLLDAISDEWPERQTHTHTGSQQSYHFEQMQLACVLNSKRKRIKKRVKQKRRIVCGTGWHDGDVAVSPSSRSTPIAVGATNEGITNQIKSTLPAWPCDFSYWTS